MQLELSAPSMVRMSEVAVDAARRAGRYLNSRFGMRGNRTYNERHDMKIEEDARAEEIIRMCLGDFTDFPVIGEESDFKEERRSYMWVVDPLDGTVNYARGIAHFSSSIALLENGAPVVGVVRNHATGDLYTAIKGEGSFCNGQPMRVSSTGSLARAISSGGFMKTEEMVLRNLAFFSKAVRETFKVRVTGSAALDLCYVAKGRFDIYAEEGIRLWDIAAGLLIACEAGARVSVSELSEFAFSVSAVTPRLEKEYVEVFEHSSPFVSEAPSLVRMPEAEEAQL